MDADGIRQAYNQRAQEMAAAAPMRVSDTIIERCRFEVEGQNKRRARALLLPLLRWRFKASELGEGFQFGAPIEIAGVRVGRYCYVGAGGRLSGPVSIGDLTMLSTGVTLVGDDHIFDDPTRPMRIAFPEAARLVTIIEADCWVGHGAILREGIRLARGTIVAAGAVVTRDTEPYSVVAGVPARLVRHRFDESAQRAYDTLIYGAGS